MLRLCLAYNEDDHVFAEAGGRITYVFDANIVRFFIDPVSEDDHVKAFRAEDLDYSGATAVITAEFLFSRGLSGQESLPAYIAPGHGEELTEFVQRKVDETAGSADDAPDRTDADNRDAVLTMLEDVLAELEAGEGRHVQQLVGRLGQLVPHLAQHEWANWSIFHQFARLYEEDLIRPLALHAACTQDILWPQKAQVKDWARRIREHRGAQDRASRNNERDAEALVQVMELDRIARDQDGEPMRYVLVTADNALFDAYCEWFWNESPDRHARFVLRRPLQYVPALNSLEMPNSVDTADLSNLAVDALDSLFSNLRAVEASYPNKLAYYRILARDENIHDRLRALYGVDPLIFDESVAEDYRNLRGVWHSTFRTGVLLNLSLMQRRYTDEIERMFEIINSDRPLQQGMREDMQRNLKRIQISHARFSTRLNLATLLEQALHVGEGEALIPRERIPFLLRTCGIALPDGFGELLKAEPTAEDLRTLVRRCASELRGNSPVDTLFAAAAIAYRCGHWGAARLYSRTCLALHPESGRMLTELEYVLAVGTRQALGVVAEEQVGLEEVAESATALDQSILRCEQAGDPFGRMRAILEQLSLRLTLRRRSALLDETWPEPTSGSDVWKSGPALPDLLEALSAATTDAEEAELVPRLAARATALIFTSLAQIRYMEPPGTVDADVDRQLRVAERAMGDPAMNAEPMRAIVWARRVACMAADGDPVAAREIEHAPGIVETDPWSSELESLEVARLSAAVSRMPDFQTG